MEKAIKSGAGVEFVRIKTQEYRHMLTYINILVYFVSVNLLSPVFGQSRNKTRNDIEIIEEEEEYGDETNLTQRSYDYETQENENDQYEEILIADTMDEVDGFQKDKNSQKQTTPQNKKRKINKRTYDDPENNVMKDARKALHDITNAIKTAPEETHSAKDMYGKFVAERLKSITDLRKRLRAQQEIDAILYQYLIDD